MVCRPRPIVTTNSTTTTPPTTTFSTSALPSSDAVYWTVQEIVALWTTHQSQSQPRDDSSSGSGGSSSGSGSNGSSGSGSNGSSGRGSGTFILRDVMVMDVGRTAFEAQYGCATGDPLSSPPSHPPPYSSILALALFPPPLTSFLNYR